MVRSAVGIQAVWAAVLLRSAAKGYLGFSAPGAVCLPAACLAGDGRGSASTRVDGSCWLLSRCLMCLFALCFSAAFLQMARPSAPEYRTLYKAKRPTVAMI